MQGRSLYTQPDSTSVTLDTLGEQWPLCPY
jgi:hypothetical protein